MRISRDELFLQIAEAYARRSTCGRLAVGAVIVYDRNIIAAGYNGVPSGEEHCSCDVRTQCTRAIHAEMNAINRVVRASGPMTIYCTASPCSVCALSISRAHVAYGAKNASLFTFERVVFRHEYGNIDEALDILRKGNVSISRLSASGYYRHYIGKGLEL